MFSSGAGANTASNVEFAMPKSESSLSVAKKLCRLSRGRQVLCVTHLPQIAAMADAQFYIEKIESDGDTQTLILASGMSGCPTLGLK